METACKVDAIAILVLSAHFAIRQYADQRRIVLMERCQSCFCTGIFPSTANFSSLLHATLHEPNAEIMKTFVCDEMFFDQPMYCRFVTGPGNV